MKFLYYICKGVTVRIALVIVLFAVCVWDYMHGGGGGGRIGEKKTDPFFNSGIVQPTCSSDRCFLPSVLNAASMSASAADGGPAASTSFTAARSADKLSGPGGEAKRAASNRFFSRGRPSAGHMVAALAASSRT
jgi:hypothetical protein